VHGDDDLRHEQVNVFLGLFTVDRVGTADRNQQHVDGQDALQQLRRTLVSDVAHMADIQSVHAVLEDDIVAAKLPFLGIMMGLNPRNPYALDVKYTRLFEYDGIPVNSRKVVVIVVVVADRDRVGGHGGHCIADFRRIGVGYDGRTCTLNQFETGMP